MKKYIVMASFSGALSVILGAFGAHGLKKVLTDAALQSFETGVKYQLIHSMLLLLIAVLPTPSVAYRKKIANILGLGTICFSGSIYLLALQIIPAKFIWFVTPLGGLLLVAAWLMIGIYTLKQQKTLS